MQQYQKRIKLKNITTKINTVKFKCDTCRQLDTKAQYLSIHQVCEGED